MEKQRQKKKRDKLRHSILEHQIPDAPTLEEFECLLGESPTNYPKGEAVEDIESELHSAAIDTEIYEKQAAERAAYEKKYCRQDESINKVLLSENSHDEIDAVQPCLTSENTLDDQIDQVQESISTIKLVDISSTIPEEPSHTVQEFENTIKEKIICHKTKKTKVLDTKKDTANAFKDVRPFTEQELASLYHNQELTLVDAFVTEFTEAQLRCTLLKQQHKLYDLLMSYLRVRNHLVSNSYELEHLKKSCRETQKQLWCLEKTSETENGECQDGNPVTATYEYSVAHFNQQTLVTLSRTLSAIKDTLHDSQTLYCYEAESLRLQIEHYIQRVATSFNEFANLSQTASANLLPEQSPSQTAPQLIELRMCITILFNFQRRILKDGKFVTDTREWLSKLIAVLLRVATWQDHLFLLNHILRCPGGVMNWAKPFVQVPVPPKISGLSSSPFNDPYLDHMIATLAVILLPIKDRDKFLEQVKVHVSLQDTTNNPGDTVWVMLDEEGEEDEDIANAGAIFFESDLISLLHQIPFDKLFEQVLFIQRQNDKYEQEEKAITDHHMLRLFAFYGILVKLLKQGLKSYDSPRYRQLAKRLSALIRDVVHYASDQWEAFDKSQITDELMLLKLQTEYDCFFLKAILCIFSSRRLGAWQYLAAIPYHIISSTTLWHIFYILHSDSTSDIAISNMSVSDWETALSCPELHRQFEEKLSNMPGDESYFLLTTFANMAMARGHKDYNFVRTTTIDLFQIGFLSEETQESCSKDARSLLSNLTSKYPTLLSDILQKLKDNFVSVGKLSLYLFTELKIGTWVPQQQDITILSTWLHQHPLTSSESHLARLILSHLNWGLDRNDTLYLPIDLHRQVALLIVELTMKYVPDTPIQTASLLTESMKQVSSIVRAQNSEQAFSLWAWEMMNKLKLHQLDRSESVCQYTISNPTESFSCVPNMESDSFLEILMKGIRERQPIASYVSVLMTLWGHSVPLICVEGFSQLQILQCYYKYEQVLICLHHVIPLFLDCPDSLLKNDKFVSLIVPLINADRTYMKIAKNLIAPEFPGPVLRQFANMIESHLHHYKRYCLNSPERFVHLWLNVLTLVQDWNKDHNVMYLMDNVIRAAFFHLESRTMTENIFQNLFCPAIDGSNENISSNRAPGSFGSFLSWATGSSNSASLLGGTVQTIWLAYQILSIEQFDKELKTGLWREILRELSMQSKLSLDAALKRACVTVKMTPFSVNNLAIYRWSQQALDTPMDHPILPLLWQNFFSLFLARAPIIPGSMDKGGVGEKFFEGMINLSYLKKLKKRLHETTEYFQVKGEKDTDNGKPITDDRRVFYFSIAKFYKTLSLWLEEPRLQEPGLYLPALPPQYMSQRLILLIQGDRALWLEYVDYWAVQQSQLKAVCEWERATFRDPENQYQKFSQPSSNTVELIDPLYRIFRRLSSYEQPVLLPPLSRNQPVLGCVARECLYNSTTVIDLVKPHLRVILDYAQTYNLMVSEHTAADCNFLELVPTLYRIYENHVTLHALCDISPSNQRRTRSGTPPTVHCAGPGIIEITVEEAHVSEGVDHMITQNRAEYENLLVKASQPPPSKVTLGCVFIDYLIAMLERELTVSRTNENTAVLRKVQESGVRLFYHLVEFYTEEAALCPPTKQLITTCLEKLGQLFISGEEAQGPQLLSAIIQRPNLGGLLGPHFTPVAGGASTFLQMYQTVVDLSTGSNVDLCFVLLSKFDVGSWLNYRRPRLSERSTFIDLVSRALCSIGLNPEEEKLMLHELFRNHLRLILLHEFPEHYGEVLSAVLRGSESQNLSLDVWRDLLGALSSKPKNIAPCQNPPKIRDEIRHYATEQRLLSRQEMHDTAVLLSRHFMKERLQYGLYGLYPKYRSYNEPLTIFLGMVGHALVVLTLQADRGSLADQLCDKIWPVLSDMFAPWITPYWTRNLREPTAAWIQQLTDDRSVLLPWIITDGPYANRTMAMFAECIRFIIDTMPASSKILSFVWQFYVANYTHSSVKDHVLNIVHGNLLSLPWDRFYPAINDIELMIKVIDQYLPDCHLFLGSIFTWVNWSVWINELMTTQSLPVASRMHVCLLNLLVKLSNEPNVRQNEKAVQLVTEAESFSWHLIDAIAYDQVINWHVMSCDPKVILCLGKDQTHAIDVAINNLLKIAAAYDPTVKHFHPTTLKKRQMYVRSSVKLLINCTTRYKSLLSTNNKAFSSTLSRMLDEMEIVITSTVSESQQVAEAGLLITEFLHSINQSGTLIDHLRSSWTAWLLERTASSPVLMGTLRVIGMAVTSSSTLGHLMEAALEAYFKYNITEDVRPTWASVLMVLQPVVPRQPPLESVLVSEGRLLALYSVLLKRLPSCRDIREEGMLLINLVDWISSIKTTDIVEDKLPLLWAKTCELAYRQCQYSENTVIAARALKGLARVLLTVADDAGQGWGILGAIGLRKGSQLTVRCKFLSRAIAVYCLAQLPESKSDQQLVRYTSHSPGVAPSRLTDPDTMEIRPSTEAVKAMQNLEGLLVNKQYVELRGDVERAIRLIKDSANSLHNVVEIVGIFTMELYNQRYLHVLTE
ncbi:PREDICTED: ectopic P granules protein 5 homolog isoform X1 [Trachymyrmex septentrionalis]|uniref:ectopic P granules protein 5 homolog isoform X1 n=1 Tax=Trachymyrmex septentrionalis TaxID=34720 RepID=UPI00084F7D6B|nr:PREDICTED: ectopic P granules protein 5 homolog isoform X1 [Trachymyrmex septentrionalis]